MDAASGFARDASHVAACDEGAALRAVQGGNFMRLDLESGSTTTSRDLMGYTFCGWCHHPSESQARYFSQPCLLGALAKFEPVCAVLSLARALCMLLY